jgi:uracil-DNA glycosylase family 4
VSGRARGLAALAADIAACRHCPRLVAWRERVARERRRAYRDEAYWGRGVPGFGDAGARLLLVGLAPGAHGANRTGRMFTGDGSGDFLYPALHRAGLASQPDSRGSGDGLALTGAFIANVCRCAPPDNRPAPAEIARCARFLDRELELLDVGAVLALGAVAFDASLAALARRGAPLPSPRPRFAHGAEVRLPGAPPVVASYHVSRQNTQTGRLTPGMFDAVLARAAALAGIGRAAAARSGARPR